VRNTPTDNYSGLPAKAQTFYAQPTTNDPLLKKNPSQLLLKAHHRRNNSGATQPTQANNGKGSGSSGGAASRGNPSGELKTSESQNQIQLFTQG
jgi:hypothetical protein